MSVIFNKFHASYVVGMLDVVDSTELISRFSADETDTFFTILLNHFLECINHTGAKIVKNVGDGFLFYMTVHDEFSADDVRATITCAETITSSLPNLNEKLRAQGMPDISVRLSMSYGPVSVMLNSNGEIADIFGSTVSTCVKMNKMAQPNTVILGSKLASYIQTQKAVKEIGVLTVNEGTSFPVFMLP